MKLLVLSANTGQGHNSCASALREAASLCGCQCDITDVFALVSQRLSRMIARSHDRTYRKRPGRSDAGYRFLEKHPRLFAPRHLIYRVMSLGSKAVGRCIRQGGYDGVFCTHVLAAMILTSALQKEKLSPCSAFVATDYSCTPGVNGTDLELYFIPHPSLTEDFLSAGIDEEKLRPYGIPVRAAFVPVADKRHAKVSVGLSPECRHLLVVCGSMGCGPVAEILRMIVPSLPPAWEITVVCGTNEELRRALKQEYAFQSRVHIRGFEQNMPGLLAASDLFLTKPGGLSTSEAMAAAVPMVFVNAVAGCESGNLRYFTNQGMAVSGDTPREVADACIGLMNHPSRLDAMAQTLLRDAKGSAALSIVQEMKKAIG
ncbi:MAG: glycosyltransferase [Clostridiales bacterium]|nr:glycosyltransferase [Clostridiales bacterium]